jgi:hypothetical protein
MANYELKTKIYLRNDVKSNWTQANPVLGKGEIGIEIDTNKIKIGDGVSTWSNLEYFRGNILVDDKSIALNEQGAVTIKGINDVGSGYTLVSDGNGGVAWSKPSETTVEGLSALISALDDRVGDIELDVESVKGEITSIKTSLNDKVSVSDLQNYLSKEEAANTYVTITDAGGIATRVTNIENAYVKSVSYEENGVFKITKQDGSVQTVDLAIEKVVTNFVYNETTKALDLTLADGTVQSIPMTAFIDDYTGYAGNEVIVEVDSSNVISAKLNQDIVLGINTAIQNAATAVAGLEGKADKTQIDELVQLINQKPTEDDITQAITNAEIQASQIKDAPWIKDVVDARGYSLKQGDSAIIPIATATALGLVRSSNAENAISINGDGFMSVNKVNVNKLSQTEGDELILNGGSAFKTAA